MIKVNFTDFWDGFNKEDNDFINVLRLHFDVELSDNPDFLFYSCFGDEYLKYDCNRIFYSGECKTPDFNSCDYAIAFDPISFGDRYLRLPIYMIGTYRERYLSLFNRKEFTKEDLDNKENFCSFVVSNCFGDDERSQFFKMLSQYRRVESGGRFLNNVGGPVEDKLAFQSKSKFVIAFENTSYPGYVTEKLMEAFDARTVPIYYGAPDVYNDFRRGSFINCADFNSFEEVVEYVKKVDKDDDLYLQYSNTRPVIQDNYSKKLDLFLANIFSQSPETAARRPSNKFANHNEDIIKRHFWYEHNIQSIVNKIKVMNGKIKNGNIL